MHLGYTAIFEDYISHLDSLGYSRGTIRYYWTVVEHFGQYCQKNRIPKKTLKRKDVNAFITDHLPGCDCHPPRPCCIKTVRAALHVLLDIKGTDEAQTDNQDTITCCCRLMMII